MGNVLDKKIIEDKNLSELCEKDGWLEFKNGFLHDSNIENNKNLGGHRPVGEDEEPEGFDEQGNPGKLNIIFGVSKNRYNNVGGDDDHDDGE